MQCADPTCEYRVVLSAHGWSHVDTHGHDIDHNAVPSGFAPKLPHRCPYGVNIGTSASNASLFQCLHLAEDHPDKHVTEAYGKTWTIPLDWGVQMPDTERRY